MGRQRSVSRMGRSPCHGLGVAPFLGSDWHSEVTASQLLSILLEKSDHSVRLVSILSLPNITEAIT